MAFLIDNFSTIGSNARKGEAPQQFSYESATDNIATIKAGNYFAEVAFQMAANDMVAVIATDGMAIMHILTSDPVAGTVTVDSNVISNQGGSDSSAAFHNIFKLSDFPVQTGELITLENGVNYLVYLDSPVNSSKLFELASPYDKGGSLIYMGGEGFLEWSHNHQGAGNIPWMFGPQQTGGTFTLKGFDVTDVNGASEGAVKISGIDESDLFDRVTIEDCIFRDFPHAVDINHVERVTLDDVDTLNPNTAQDEACIDVLHGSEIRIRGCDLEQTSQTVVALEIHPIKQSSGLAHTHVEDCEFNLNTTNIGAVNIDPASDYDGIVIISNCSARDSANNPAMGLKTDSMGAIQKIENAGTGQVKVTTYQNHNLAALDFIGIFGTLNYDTQNTQVKSAPAPTAKTFEVNDTFSADNYAGSFFKGSLNTYNMANFSVSDGIGFEGSGPQGCIMVSNSAAVQATGSPVIDKRINFSTLGEIQAPRSSIPKDTQVSDYDDVELKYTGDTTVVLKASITVTSDKGTGTTDCEIFFRLANDAARDTDRSTWTTSAQGSYTYEAMVRVNPGDTITPFIRLTSENTNINISNVNFTIIT